MIDNTPTLKTAAEESNESPSEAATVTDIPSVLADSKLNYAPEVTWDGSDDPENPQNWPKWKKWYLAF